MKKPKKQDVVALAGTIIAIYLAVILIQTVRRNYELKQKIANLEAQISELTDERQELEYRIEYYKTEAYKEKEARAKLGLQLPGESVIILPKRELDPSAQLEDAKKTIPRKSNIKQWWEFLFG